MTGGPLRDRGSVLALVPAGFLVLILLAALSVDSAVSYLGQRQLHDSLAAAANDAVTAGLDNAAFYHHGSLTLDAAGVERAVCLSFVAQNASGLHDVQLWMATGADRVHLEGRARVDVVFGRAVPGFGQRTVRSSADAVVTNSPLHRAAASAAMTGPLATVTCPGL